MKFGKEFKEQMVPEWSETYFDYDGLKIILHGIKIFKQSKQTSMPLRRFHQLPTKAFSGLNPQASNFQESRVIEDEAILINTVKSDDDSRNYYSTEILRLPEEGREEKVNFFRKLDDELNKVNKFYKDRVKEVIKEAGLLNKQMDVFIAYGIKVENPDAKRCEPGNRRLSVLDRAKINHTLESPMSTIKRIFKGSKAEELFFDKNEFKYIEDMLKSALVEFHQKLRILKHYSSMNISAFSMILKKYEKITSRSAAGSYTKVVDNSYLGSCYKVNSLLYGVEATVIKYYTDSDRAAAMKLLRPKHKREKYRITFLCEFLFGYSIALLVIHTKS